MDHTHMDHSAHDHAAMGHGAGSGDTCSMSMLFTWDTSNLCLIFRQWHIRSNFQLLVSLGIVVGLTMGYEALRAAVRRYEERVKARIEGVPKRTQSDLGRRAHIIKAALYALQNFYAFMLMLLFMTYNGWVMIAMTVGAFSGYLVFGGESSAAKDGACH